MKHIRITTLLTLLFLGFSFLSLSQNGIGTDKKKIELDGASYPCLTKDEISFAEKSQGYRVNGRNCVWSAYSDSTVTFTYRESTVSSSLEGRLQIGNKLYEIRGELQEGLGIYRASLWWGDLKGFMYWEPKPAPEHNHEEECEEYYTDIMIVQVNLCDKKIVLELSN